MSKFYDERIWPVRLNCSSCGKKIGAITQVEKILYSLILHCEECDEWVRVDASKLDKQHNKKGIEVFFQNQ